MCRFTCWTRGITYYKFARKNLCRYIMANKEKYTPIFHESSVLPGELPRQKSTSFSNDKKLGTDEFLAGALTKPDGEQIIGPWVRLSHDQVITSAGQPTTLECQVLEWSSKAERRVHWLHDGVLCQGERYLSLSDAERYYLFIRDTVAEDGGEYTIVASSGPARTEKVLKVRVTQPQHPESDPNHVCYQRQDFPSYVKKSRGSQALVKEFFEVELMWDVSQHTANLVCNMYKNRYCNVFPYDHSRVVLSLQQNIPGSDYINASHITDRVCGCRYIATQGPLQHTYADFWRMVVEFDVHVIAMVTKTSDTYGIRKENYWPIEGSSTYDDVRVTLNHIEKERHWIKRSLTIAKINATGTELVDEGASRMPRSVVQFQFVSWPEYGVPKRATDLLSFRQCVAEHYEGSTGPLLVHCSAGVGRTGTFITIDLLLKRMEREGTVDVFNLVRALRLRRERTVETPEQYMLIHEAIAEVITSGNQK